MSSAEIERRVADYYAGKLREHGATYRGVDWSSGESQLLRFEQLSRAIPNGERISLLDYGCGYGALADYLDRQDADLDYIGYDVSTDMTAAAQHGPGRSFVAVREQLDPVDVAVASGIFNVRVGVEEGRWRDYTLETISDLASLSRRALAFNMLTGYADPERMTDRLFYADPCFYFDWCKQNLSRHVALLHDYGLWEFTILVRFDDA